MRQPAVVPLCVCADRYDDPRAHELELRDVPLMSAWRQAILGNAALFRGATVLDVGCGLGALSLLCAKVRGHTARAVVQFGGPAGEHAGPRSHDRCAAALAVA